MVSEIQPYYLLTRKRFVIEVSMEVQKRNFRQSKHVNVPPTVHANSEFNDYCF